MTKKIITAVAVILAVILSLGLLVRFAGDGDDFTVRFNGEEISDGAEDIELCMNREYRFDMDFLKRNADYTVKIVPNITDETDFIFTDSASTSLSYSCIDELTDGFGVDLHGEYFTLTAKDLPELISGHYGLPADAFSGIPSAVNSEKSYFTLIVSSGKRGFWFDFRLITGITVEPDEVTF